MGAANEAKIDTLVDKARSIIDSEGVTRASLDKVLNTLKELADIPDQWTEAQYDAPEQVDQHSRYLIRSSDDKSFTLYLNVMRPGKLIPPHNHTTWACIASVEGTEHNTLYNRVDGGTGAGPAELEVSDEIEVRPGHGIALLPDDIHSVQIKGERPIRHLHFYGMALETLTERLAFDREAKTAAILKMTVATQPG